MIVRRHFDKAIRVAHPTLFEPALNYRRFIIVFYKLLRQEIFIVLGMSGEEHPALLQLMVQNCKTTY